MRISRRSGISLVVLAALSLAPAATVQQLVSAVLEGRRDSSLHCTAINNSTAPIDDVIVTLKRPDGTVLAGPTECDALASGASCVQSHPIAFPALDVAAYCHVEAPYSAWIRGNLRLEDSGSATLAESTLQGDVHGQIGALIEKVEWMLGGDG